MSNDPRGELRWCLSKIRKLLGRPDRRRIVTSGDRVALDLADCFVDVFEIDAAAREGFERLDAKRLAALSGLFLGDFLAGMEIDRCPQFEGWLTAQRRRFRSLHVAVLEHLEESFRRNQTRFCSASKIGSNSSHSTHARMRAS